MNKTKAFKNVAKFVVGAGTSNITHSIIRNNVEPTTRYQQVSIAVASLVIGSMAADATTTHTDARIDELLAGWNERNESTVTEIPETN